MTCLQVLDRGDSKDYEFRAVSDGSPENKEFWKWTPTGVLQFSCVNPNVSFQPGKSYYVDICEATNV
jgi:hypothetical protein